MKTITNYEIPAIIWACSVEFKEKDTVAKNFFSTAYEALDWADKYVTDLCNKYDTVAIPHNIVLTSSIRRDF